jgi:hypothetical protein
MLISPERRPKGPIKTIPGQREQGKRLSARQRYLVGRGSSLTFTVLSGHPPNRSQEHSSYRTASRHRSPAHNLADIRKDKVKCDRVWDEFVKLLSGSFTCASARRSASRLVPLTRRLTCK